MDWLSLKAETARLLLEKDALHIYAAFAIQVGTAILARRSVGHILPWLTVLVFELTNELGDIWFGGEPAVMPWQMTGALHDLFNTMALPSALLLLCRYAPSLFAWPRTQIIRASNQRPR